MAYEIHFGFEVCDSVEPWYELVAKKYDDRAGDPRVWDSARRGTRFSRPHY